MTPEEVRALTDEALDRLVAVEVMGAGPWLTRGSMWRANPFSTDGNTMLALIKKMRADGWDYVVQPSSTGPAGDPDVSHHIRWFDVTFQRFDDSDDREAFAMHETLPRATAMAAVLARAAQHQGGGTLMSETENVAVLWAHLVSKHAGVWEPDGDLAEAHGHEHDGPGTIRNHPRDDRSYDLVKMAKVMSELEDAIAEPEPQGVEEWRTPEVVEHDRSLGVPDLSKAARDDWYTLVSNIELWDCGDVESFKRVLNRLLAAERTRWAAREQQLVEALTQERAKFQSETLQTDTLLRLIQEAARLWADGDHLFMGQRHEFGRQYDDDCPVCWWRQLAADLRTRVTADVLGDARAALGQEEMNDAE